MALAPSTFRQAGDRHPWGYAALGALALLAVLLTVRVYLSEGAGRWSANGWVLHPDQMTHVTLVWDLHRGWENLGGWQFSRAPFFFPDHILYAALDGLTGNFRWSLLLQGAVVAVGYLLTMAAAVRRLERASWMVAAGAVAVAVVPLFLGVLAVKPEFFFQAYIYPFFGGNHFSAFLLALIALLSGLSALEAPSPAAFLRALAAVLALTALTLLSNRIFLVLFIAPAALVAMLHLWLTRRPLPVLGAALAVAAGVGLAMVADGFLTRQADVGVTVTLASLWSAAKAMSGYVGRFGWIGSLCVYGPLVLAAALVPWVTVTLIRRPAAVRGADGQERMRFLFITALAAMIPLNALAQLSTITSPSMGWLNAHYLMAPFFAPPVLVALALGRRWRTRPAEAGAGLTAAFLLVVGGIIAEGRLRPPLLDWHSWEAAELMACRDRLGLRSGLASYWYSKPVIAETGGRLQLNQLSSGRNAMYWGNNLLWFIDSFDVPGQPPVYNFIVANRLDEAEIREGFGSPDRVESCGSLTLFLYDDTDRLFRRLVEGQPLLAAAMIRRGQPVVFAGDRLPSQTGRADAGARTAVAGRDDVGAVVHGPYIDLPAGHYTLTVQYRATGAAGRYDIAGRTGAVVLADGSLPPGNGTEPLSLPVSLDLPEGMPNVELRVFFAGTGSLSVETLTIQRGNAVPLR